MDHFARLVTGMSCVALACVLGWIVLAEPAAGGLRPHVLARLEEAAVSSEVTAVLLDFRGWDTLLEVAVLVTALVAIRALERGRPAVPPAADASTEPVLAALVRGVVPVIVLVAVYLVWRGGHAPGGAFQGGALLGGAVVLVLAAGFHRVGQRTRSAARYVATAALGFFVVVAAALLAARGSILDYPATAAYAIVLLIEALLAIATAAILADLFVDVPSVNEPGGDRP